jgi:hypothetical protein
MDRLHEIVDVLPLDPDHAVEALKREVERLPPASVDEHKPGKGARDVAIWLTAVAQAVRSGQAVYLVSSDKAAFGPGTRDSLTSEATDQGGSVIFCATVAELLERFATQIDLALPVDDLLQQVPVLSAVRESLGALTFLAASAAVPDGARDLFSSTNGLDLRASSVVDAHGYQVHGQTWITLHSTWGGDRIMTRHVDSSLTEDWEVRFEQRLTLLLRMTDDNIVESADIMDWDGPTITDAQKVGSRVLLGVATETDVAGSVTPR